MVRMILVAFVALLVCEPAYAHHVTYSAYRRHVEETCATNRMPKDERIFVRVMPTGSERIVRFHKGITLREIIDQTSFKGRVAWICVLRSDHPVLDQWTRVGR